MQERDKQRLIDTMAAAGAATMHSDFSEAIFSLANADPEGLKRRVEALRGCFAGLLDHANDLLRVAGLPVSEDPHEAWGFLLTLPVFDIPN